jgi:hypothetical protein
MRKVQSCDPGAGWTQAARSRRRWVLVLRAHAKFVLTLPWFLLRSRWQQARFKEGAEHEIVVMPGPDGRPGERLVAPGRALHAPKVVFGGSRNDFSLYLDRAGSYLSGVCLGPVAERGEPEASARDTVAHFWGKGFVTHTPLAFEEVAGEPAFRYRLAFGRTQLTEWKFAHGGWLYVVGAMNRAADEGGTLERARRVLDTWVWLPG